MAALKNKHINSGEISWGLRLASDKLKNDKEVVMAAVTQNGAALEYAPFKWKNDKEIVMLAALNSVKLDLHFGSTPCDPLQHASSKLRHDKDVVMTAVAINGYALKFASAELRNDKEVIAASEQESAQLYSPTVSDDDDDGLSTNEKEYAQLYAQHLDPEDLSINEKRQPSKIMEGSNTFSSIR